MNNDAIIMQEALASGFFTEEELQSFLETGQEIPFHTYAVWKRKGMVPKAGSHGWQTRLWKRKSGMDEGFESDNNRFFLTKSFLFHETQCEPSIEIKNEGRK